MDKLFQHCKEEQNSAFILEFSSGGGSLEGVCQCSATFCTWLEREALDLKTLGRHGVSERELRKVVAQAVETVFPSEETKPSVPNVNVEERQNQRRARRPRTVTSLAAARRIEAYLDKGKGQNELSIRANVSERTIRTVRKTGKAELKTFDSLTDAMGITREELLAQFDRKDIGKISER